MSCFTNFRNRCVIADSRVRVRVSAGDARPRGEKTDKPSGRPRLPVVPCRPLVYW